MNMFLKARQERIRDLYSRILDYSSAHTTKGWSLLHNEVLEKQIQFPFILEYGVTLRKFNEYIYVLEECGFLLSYLRMEKSIDELSGLFNGYIVYPEKKLPF